MKKYSLWAVCLFVFGILDHASLLRQESVGLIFSTQHLAGLAAIALVGGIFAARSVDTIPTPRELFREMEKEGDPLFLKLLCGLIMILMTGVFSWITLSGAWKLGAYLLA